MTPSEPSIPLSELKLLRDEVVNGHEGRENVLAWLDSTISNIEGEWASTPPRESPHRRVFEYDGSFRCRDCRAQWGALPGRPVEPGSCASSVQCVDCEQTGGRHAGPCVVAPSAPSETRERCGARGRA